jgi:serine/threonine-protein kinase
MLPQQGTVVADRFLIEHRLGQGGMGSVWLAKHLSLDIPCALKFLHPDAAASADLRARFEREAKAAAQLRSPHVVQILDHGVWEGVPFIAMELLEGEDLDQRLRRVGRLDARSTVKLIAEVARALTKAHNGGLVHRDLKPSNIFLVRDDDREIAKVLDFGVAKRTQHEVSDSKTKTGAILGTPFYMSPEQARGLREVDHRSDLWALGVITYQCLLGRLPFESTALGDLFMKIMTDPLPVPSQIAPVPASFDAWWQRAAARDPAQRFQSARELSDGLAVALGMSGASPEMGGQTALLPGAHSFPPAPSAALGTTPMGPQTASAVAVPTAAGKAPRSNTIAIAGGVGVLAVAGAAAAFFLLRGPDKPAAGVATAAPARADVTATASASASDAPTVAPAPASALPAVEPTPSASASSVPSVAVSTAKPAVPQKPSGKAPSAPATPKPTKPVHDDGI